MVGTSGLGSWNGHWLVLDSHFIGVSFIQCTYSPLVTWIATRLTHSRGLVSGVIWFLSAKIIQKTRVKHDCDISWHFPIFNSYLQNHFSPKTARISSFLRKISDFAQFFPAKPWKSPPSHGAPWCRQAGYVPDDAEKAAAAAAPAAPEVETVQATERAHYNGKMVIYNT